MAQKPNQHIIGASHGGDYARDMSGRSIQYIKENQETLGFGLQNEATDLWRTTNGCVYRAAGAGGSITGRRADLFIIDDPIKGRQDADSPTYGAAFSANTAATLQCALAISSFMA
jgi:hypothetical protein